MLIKCYIVVTLGVSVLDTDVLCTAMFSKSKLKSYVESQNSLGGIRRSRNGFQYRTSLDSIYTLYALRSCKNLVKFHPKPVYRMFFKICESTSICVKCTMSAPLISANSDLRRVRIVSK